MVWTRFFDCYSGGALKIPPFEVIYVEAPDYESALNVMYNRFCVEPLHASCGCCGGQDYHILLHADRDTLMVDRGNLSVESYLVLPYVRVLPATEILADEYYSFGSPVRVGGGYTFRCHNRGISARRRVRERHLARGVPEAHTFAPEQPQPNPFLAFTQETIQSPYLRRT